MTASLPEIFDKCPIYTTTSPINTCNSLTIFGTRYAVEGTLVSPDGRNPVIRSAWFMETGETIPKFVTSYPLKWREE
ncbi:DUF6883 domain-containing protein [Nostoc sp.]|uniref:DUF6883 domain-containing protein n=1 Tax=Nostoc sp. TaxID=1180 RepID=UPI003593F498